MVYFVANCNFCYWTWTQNVIELLDNCFVFDFDYALRVWRYFHIFYMYRDSTTPQIYICECVCVCTYWTRFNSILSLSSSIHVALLCIRCQRMKLTLMTDSEMLNYFWHVNNISIEANLLYYDKIRKLKTENNCLNNFVSCSREDTQTLFP